MDKLKEDADDFADKVLQNLADVESDSGNDRKSGADKTPQIFCQTISHQSDVTHYCHQSRKTLSAERLKRVTNVLLI